MTQLNDTLNVKRDAPPSRTFSKPYWDATREKKLLIQYDSKAGRYQFFPRPTSVASGRRGLEWREVSGKGEIFSYTIARRTREPFRGHEPFLIVLVTLDEGVNVMANMVDCGIDEIKIGLRAKPYWAPLPNGTHLLMFTPDRTTLLRTSRIKEHAMAGTPDHPITVTPNPNRVKVTFAGKVVADTKKAVNLQEAKYAPVVYVPRADVDMTLLAKTAHSTHCPYKGDASYYSIKADGRVAENAIWSYEQPLADMTEIKGYVAFYPNRVDAIEQTPA